MPTPVRKVQPGKRPARAPSTCAEDCVHLTSDSLHDLASPVNQLGSLTDLVVKKYAGNLDDEAKVLFGYLSGAVDRLQNLLTGLRTFMRVTGAPLSLRGCDANVLLASALTMIQHTVAQSGALVTHDPLPEVRCDAVQITYTLAGLIENSIKFRGERTPEIHVGAVPDQKACILSVRDNGMGIDPRHADRIFQTFKRIHGDTYPGAGMGLAIARRVMDRHHGRIWVDSQLGQGATFFLALPKRATMPASPRVGA
jgi:light-regulated signal transduction histidine kinase (bacteriophytochrome)